MTLDTKNIDIRVYPILHARSIQKLMQVPCFLIHCKNDEKVSVARLNRI